MRWTIPIVVGVLAVLALLIGEWRAAGALSLVFSAALVAADRSGERRRGKDQ